MKRFQLLVMVAAITAAAIWWSFYRSRHTSSAAITELLPKQTLAFVHLPDFVRSRAEFHQTDLYQLWEEPAVQAFLQRPRGKIPANFALGTVMQECESLQMKDLFVAVTAIENSAWQIVGGFRFHGDSSDAEKIVASWKRRLLGKEKDLQDEIVVYQSHQIQTSTDGFFRLSTVHIGQQYFLANTLEPLKQILDRVDGRVRDANTLASDDAFTAASKRMPSIYTVEGFAHVSQLVEKLLPPPENGEPESTDRMAAIRQIRSLCAATSFDGGKIRDTIFIGMPKLNDSENLLRISLPIATKDSFLYAANLLNLTKPIALGSTSPVDFGWTNNVKKIIASLSASGVTLENWNSAFGGELSCIGNWPSESHWPSFFVTLPVKDSAKAKSILATISERSADSAPWTTLEEKEGVQYYSISTGGGAFFPISPTIGLSERILVAGANPSAVEAASKRFSNGNSELAASKTFRTSERSVPPAQQTFVYVDLAMLYTRLDATLRPMLVMGAAFLPGIADTVDPSKLPTSETITKHLSPIVMSQRYDTDGYVSESVGPVTAFQTILGVVSLSGAAALIYQMQTHGLASSSGQP